MLKDLHQQQKALSRFEPELHSLTIRWSPLPHGSASFFAQSVPALVKSFRMISLDCIVDRATFKDSSSSRSSFFILRVDIPVMRCKCWSIGSAPFARRTLFDSALLGKLFYLAIQKRLCSSFSLSIFRSKLTLQDYPGETRKVCLKRCARSDVICDVR